MNLLWAGDRNSRCYTSVTTQMDAPSCLSLLEIHAPALQSLLLILTHSLQICKLYTEMLHVSSINSAKLGGGQVFVIPNCFSFTLKYVSVHSERWYVHTTIWQGICPHTSFTYKLHCNCQLLDLLDTSWKSCQCVHFMLREF